MKDSEPERQKGDEMGTDYPISLPSRNFKLKAQQK